MNKLILWLGNWWDKLKWTHHNVWHMFIDYVGGLPWATIDIGTPNDNSLVIVTYNDMLFIKYMWCINNSWEVIDIILWLIEAWVEPEIIIVHDDMDTTIGKVKAKTSGWSGGHNWIKDIIKYMWEDFQRYKIWIGRPPEWTTVVDHVLGEFTDKELAILKNKKAFEKVYTLIHKL